MEELEELREGRLVKNSPPRDQQTPQPPPPTHIPFCCSICPSPRLCISHLGETCLASHGGGEILERVCFSLTQHIEF